MGKNKVCSCSYKGIEAVVTEKNGVFCARGKSLSAKFLCGKGKTQKEAKANFRECTDKFLGGMNELGSISVLFA